MGDLTKNFSSLEFSCHCGCGYQEINPLLVEKLQKVREKFGSIKINSGCRCKKHNQKAGGKIDSAHVAGWAADLQCNGSSPRFRLVQCFLEEGFHRIGIGKTFIHVDMDPLKPRGVIWLYSTNLKEN